jgi:Spy/CpxP family protein refolding chaperone
MNVARVIVIGLMTLLTAVPRAGAQPFKWWQDEKTKAQLGLTAEQATKIEEVFQASLATQRKKFEELNRREKEFSVLLLKDDATEAQVMREAEQVESLRGELGKARTLMLFRMNRILTAEQRIKVNEMHDRRDRDRRTPSPVKK